MLEPMVTAPNFVADLLAAILPVIENTVSAAVSSALSTENRPARLPPADDACPAVPTLPKPPTSFTDAARAQSADARASSDHQACEVTINLKKVAQNHELRSATPAAIKRKLDDAASTDNRSFQCHGVRLIKDTHFVVRTCNPADAAFLRKEKAKWLPKFAEGAVVMEEKYQVVVNMVPIQFAPSDSVLANTTTSQLHHSNPQLIHHPDNITDARWLKGTEATVGANKKHSSLVLSINDRDVADNLIYHGVSVDGQLCEARRFHSSPDPCKHCQSFNHITPACPHLSNSDKLACARCAGNHATRDCPCSHTTKCSDKRTCTHFIAKCANCHGDHKALDKCCPIKKAAISRSLKHPSNTSKYFNPFFSPVSRPSARHF